MKVIVCENYDEMSLKAAEIVKEQIEKKPDSVLGFATGSTPIGTYRCLADMHQNGLDFSKVISFNLDEYYPIKNSDPQSYHYFMEKNLFQYVNIDKANTHIPNGETDDPDAECEAYEKQIEECGHIDLQILGIGRNGHIGFNEPDTRLNTKTHVTPLSEDTMDANSRFFESGKVIEHALTMGISTILSSKKIILLANGRSKHKAVSELLSDKITTNNPSTILKVHPDVTLICDREAYSDARIGIDIGGMSIKIGVVDNNKIIERASLPVDPQADAAEITDGIAGVCSDLMSRYPVSAVGVGAPGLISHGRITAVNLPFYDFPLEKTLEDKLKTTVKVENDANCAALGESAAGAAVNEDNTILLTIGTGIGSGIIIDNRIYSGTGHAGEAGHMCIDINGIPCNCGRAGCWEQYASATALIKQVKRAAAENPDSELAKLAGEQAVTGMTVFEAMDRGCPVAEAVFDRYLDYLASGIMNLINLFSPELVLISGGISNAGDKLIKPLSAKISSDVPVRIAALKNDAGIIGAAAM